MDKQTARQLVQGISKLGSCACPKVWKSIWQETPLSPPGALCCSETAYHILTKMHHMHSFTAQPKQTHLYINFTSTSHDFTVFAAFSGRQAEASADLRWVRRTASAKNWLEIVPPLRSCPEFSQLCIKASQMDEFFLGAEKICMFIL